MNTLIQLSPIILMFVIFYFLLIRPQQKRQKKVREMQADVKKGDSVVTIGGLHGTIHQIDENIVVVETDNTKLKFDRASIREVKNMD